MFGYDLWDILGIIAIISLIITFFRGKNAIWGILTFGIIICLMVGLYYYFYTGNFNTHYKKILTITILLGLLIEIMGLASKKYK